MSVESTPPLAIHRTVDDYEKAIETLFEALAAINASSSSEAQQINLDRAVDGLLLQDAKLGPALDEGPSPYGYMSERRD